MHQRSLTRFRFAQIAIGLGLLVGVAQAQETITSDVVTIRTDSNTGKIVLELVDKDGQRLVVTATKIDITTSDKTAITGTLGLTATGAIELSPPAAQTPRVVIGITTEPLAAALAAQLSLAAGDAIVVAEVAEGLPAQLAGILVHDVITAINGKEHVTQDLLSALIADYAPGDVVQVDLIRAGNPIRCAVTAQAYVEARVDLDALVTWEAFSNYTLTDGAIGSALAKQRALDYAVVLQDTWATQLTTPEWHIEPAPFLAQWFISNDITASTANEPRASLRAALNELRAKIDEIETLLDALNSEPAEDKKD